LRFPDFSPKLRPAILKTLLVYRVLISERLHVDECLSDEFFIGVSSFIGGRNLYCGHMGFDTVRLYQATYDLPSVVLWPHGL
jgi:hypothetical protein